MIKLIVAIHRRPDMTVEDFQDHWRRQHAHLVKENPATKRYIRKYVQCHTLASEYQQNEAAFDGTAEIWFDSVED